MTFTKEQLQNLIEFNSSDSDGQANAESWEVHKLAEMALAGMEAEPVGEVSEQSDGLVMDGTVNLGGKSTHRIINGASKMKRLPLGTKFYTAPQPLTTTERAELEDYRNAQQVAPSITQHFDDIALETAREIMCDVNRRHEFLGGEVQLLSRIQCRVDDACRAAMLQGGK